MVKKISTKAFVKKVVCKKGSTEIQFSDMKFSGGQIESLAKFAEEKSQVTLTIEEVQGNFLNNHV
jgi:hypothetical protein